MTTDQSAKPRYVWTPSGPVLKSGSDRTIKDFLAELEAKELTVTAWAREKSLPVRAVFSLISGHYSGHHGKAREVLKAMGVKPPPVHVKRGARWQRTQGVGAQA